MFTIQYVIKLNLYLVSHIYLNVSLMKLLQLLTLLFIPSLCFSQSPGDTIVVHPLNYGMTYGLGERDTLVDFPNDPSLEFHKILMLYSMRCKNGLVSNGTDRNRGCGEWDYSCNTYIEDDSRVDSIEANINSHYISNYSGNSFDFVYSPAIDYHRKVYKKTTLNSIISENTYTSGTYSTNIEHTFPVNLFNGKSQYIYTASELSAAGLTSGDINGFILYPLDTLRADFCKIKIKSVSNSTLDASSGADTSGFSEVYFDKLVDYASTGGKRIMFHTPYNWDGVSNLLIEFSYTNSTTYTGSNMPTLQGYTAALQGISSGGAQYPLFQGTNYLTVTGYKGISGSNPRTVEAWVKTTSNNNEIISWGLNSNTEKYVVRVNGNGALRTEVAGGYIIGTTNIADGQWHHVASVLNGNSVNNITLYVDGVQEVISSSQNISINTANSNDVSIGHGLNNTYFNGNIDNVRVWSAALSASTIAEYKNADIPMSHPNISDLELNLSRDSINANQWEDLSQNNRNADIQNGLWLEKSYGEYLHDNFSIQNEKPVLNFLKGTYNTTISLDSVYLEVTRSPNSVTVYSITDNSGTLVSDVVVVDTIMQLWDTAQGNRYFAEDGTLENSTSINPDGNISISTLNYWRRTPMAFEIMSFVTPFGIFLNLGPEGQTWTFDVTDFAPLFKGQKRLFMNKGGQWQEDMDIKFLFIVGTPPRKSLDINNLWMSNRSVRYEDLLSQKYFPPRTVTGTTGAESYKLRTTITGHGQEGEFIPRNHIIKANNSIVKNWLVNKECGYNPIYPQGGTWIYDRAGWCPGMATDLEETDLTPNFSTGSAILDYDITTASGDSRYIISNQLVSYGANNFSHDAELLDIMHPTKKVEHLRSNPSCNDPVIILRNTGEDTLKTAVIEYGINSGTSKGTYNWSGSLGFLETDTITLPADFFNIWSDITRDTNNLFFAEIKQINGGDEYEHNNTAHSYFDIPRVFPSEFIILIKTNNAPAETTYEVVDKNGVVYFSEHYTSPNSVYRDTISLPQGCYTLQLQDSDDDGIEWWANNDGAGQLRLFRTNGLQLYQIDGDFGGEYSLDFTVDWPLRFEELNNLYEVQLSPNPAKNLFVLQAPDIKDAQINVFDLIGREVYPDMLENSQNSRTFDASQLSEGVYTITIRNKENLISKKLVINK